MKLCRIPLAAALSLPAGVIAAPVEGTQQIIELQSSREAATSQRKLHGRFLHITGALHPPWDTVFRQLTRHPAADFHPDAHYRPHTSTKANKACHRGQGPAGYYGAETSDCDSPYTLVNATFDWIGAHLKDDIDFIIWTGDSARHDSDEKYDRSEKEVVASNRVLADKFVETFSDIKGRLSIPVVPTFGNNDILPHNIMLGGPNKWLKMYSDIWKSFIPEAQRHTFEQGGWFYTEVVPNKLAVFSLNSLYFFERNAGIDDCTHPSEPGYQQMEWLRVQLEFMRSRGMKAILMGHVPPARTPGKQNWDETCWQKYTLWLKQYRDVITASLYGHMNIDHFFLQDFKDINRNYLKGDTDEYKKHRDRKHDKNNKKNPHTHPVSELGQNDVSTQSGKDYLRELREDWAALPDEAIHATEEDEVEAEKKGKKHPLGGRWAERYALSMVSPSIVPNYFPTIRVFEYNITGLESAPTWLDMMQSRASETPAPAEDDGSHRHQLELRSDDVEFETEKKKKKGKKGKKGKGNDDPYLIVPKPPAKTSPPGPAYSPQPLTLTGYTQYFANLTYINNDARDFVDEKETDGNDGGVSTEGWNEGVHRGKQPSHAPEPRPFNFEVEYSTLEDKLYKIKDLTVGSFIKLAYRIGREDKSKAMVNSAQEASPDEESVGEPSWASEEDDEDYDDDNDDDDEYDEDQDDLDDDEGEQKDGAAGHKRRKGKKGKKGKKGSNNKVWLHFLRHAFVSTVSKKQLKKL